jgi:Protein of unknown function (DUF3293)
MALLPPDDPWAAYAGTIVQIVRPAEGDFVTVRGAPPGGPRGKAGRWPWASEEPVAILTAWDPGDERPGVEVNRRRGVKLESEVRRRAKRVLHAVGVDPSSEHREEGVAVLGLAVDEVVALGARYRQEAIFVWTPEAWSIVSCRGEARRIDFSWSVVVLRPM